MTDTQGIVIIIVTAIVLIALLIGGLIVKDAYLRTVNDCPEREDLCPSSDFVLNIEVPKGYTCVLSNPGAQHHTLICD